MAAARAAEHTRITGPAVWMGAEMQARPEWCVRLSTEHVAEVLHRGRLADGSLALDALGFSPRISTPEVIERLYQWESVVRIAPTRQPAAA